METPRFMERRATNAVPPQALRPGAPEEEEFYSRVRSASDTMLCRSVSFTPAKPSDRFSDSGSGLSEAFPSTPESAHATPFAGHSRTSSSYARQVRGSRATSGSATSFRRGSNASFMTIPSMFTGHGDQQTIFGVPEELTIQEFAYRRGQAERHRLDDRVPPTPFSKMLAHERIWEEWYTKGRASGRPGFQGLGAPVASPSLENYKWAPLINVWAQTPENPMGVLDTGHVYRVCDTALDTMRNLVRCAMDRDKRRGPVVVDVPHPVAEALQQFDDLSVRYNILLHAAEVAKAGGVPTGF